MPTEKPDGKTIQAVLTGATELPPPSGANYFHFSRFGLEFQLVIGTVNLLQLHEITRGDDAQPSIVPLVTHRFLLSPFGFAQLKAAVDAISQGMPAPGEGIEISAERSR